METERVSKSNGVLTLAKGEEERKAFASKIAKAVLTFQNQLLDRDANTGSLCQVLLPFTDHRLVLYLRHARFTPDPSVPAGPSSGAF